VSVAALNTIQLSHYAAPYRFTIRLFPMQHQYIQCETNVTHLQYSKFVLLTKA